MTAGTALVTSPSSSWPARSIATEFVMTTVSSTSPRRTTFVATGSDVAVEAMAVVTVVGGAAAADDDGFAVGRRFGADRFVGL